AIFLLPPSADLNTSDPYFEMFSGIVSTSETWDALHLPGCCSQFVTGRVAPNAKCGKRHGSPGPASAQVPHSGVIVANIPARDTVSSMSRGHPRSSHMSTREQPMNAIQSLRGDRMRRRDLLKMIGGAATALPFAAQAQKPAMPLVGYLSTFSSAGDAR